MTGLDHNAIRDRFLKAGFKSAIWCGLTLALEPASKSRAIAVARSLGLSWGELVVRRSRVGDRIRSDLLLIACVSRASGPCTRGVPEGRGGSPRIPVARESVPCNPEMKTALKHCKMRFAE